MPGNYHIGTSGWNYKHWKETVYPEDISQKEWLGYYQQKLKTVEINNSFYRLPEPKTFRKWKNTADGEFIFAVKASRYLTHMKKLKDPGDSLDNMLETFASLEEKLGPILFQLPPRWKFNADRLSSFIDLLPQKQNRYTFEFRDKSWINDSTLDLLKDHNIAFCIYDLAGYQSPLHITADFVYVRLHGPAREKYQGKYTEKQLSEWAERINNWQDDNLDVFLYFDNDQKGYAAHNAMELNEMLSS